MSDLTPAQADALRLEEETRFLRLQAQAILENEAWRKIKADLANRHHLAWVNGKTVEDRELAWGKMRGLTDVILELEVMLTAGPIAYAEPEPPTSTEGNVTRG